VPSSSLPVASSDNFDPEIPPTSSSGGQISSGEGEDGEDETMQFWSTGLPPSSPPPPTSPVLPPQTEEDTI
jgi:hypothetical protein